MRELVQHHGTRTDLVRRFMGLARRLTRELYDGLGDWFLGITTRDRLILRELGIEEQPGRPDRSIHYGVDRRALRYVRPTLADSLLDLGCGSGRLICFAAQFAFSRIIGVELNPGLAAIAARNVDSLRSSAVHPEVVRADAAAFQVPDDITVVWMFNPFHGEVFRVTLTRILESYNRRPRRLRLLNYNPREHDIVTSVGRFRQTDALRVWWWPSADNKRFRMINVYEVVAP